MQTRGRSMCRLHVCGSFSRPDCDVAVVRLQSPARWAQRTLPFTKFAFSEAPVPLVGFSPELGTDPHKRSLRGHLYARSDLSCLRFTHDIPAMLIFSGRSSDRPPRRRGDRHTQLLARTQHQRQLQRSRQCHVAHEPLAGTHLARRNNCELGRFLRGLRVCIHFHGATAGSFARVTHRSYGDFRRATGSTDA